MDQWFEEWFNEDYLKLYAHRSEEEARRAVEFIVGVLKLPVGSRILDLACGTGRHAQPLAEAGYDVVGLDFSKHAIQLAEERMREGLALTFVVGDMRKLNGMGTFDAVLNIFTSFGYFESDEENEGVFKEVRNSLKDGGHFVLDFLHPAQVIQDLQAKEVLDVDGEEVVIEKVIEDHTVVKTIHFPNRTYHERVKLYTRDQIEAMLHRQGFEVVALWNDYRGNPWTAQGDRQIFHCVARV